MLIARYKNISAVQDGGSRQIQRVMERYTTSANTILTRQRIRSGELEPRLPESQVRHKGALLHKSRDRYEFVMHSSGSIFFPKNKHLTNARNTTDSS